MSLVLMTMQWLDIQSVAMAMGVCAMWKRAVANGGVTMERIWRRFYTARWSFASSRGQRQTTTWRQRCIAQSGTLRGWFSGRAHHQILDSQGQHVRSITDDPVHRSDRLLVTTPESCFLAEAPFDRPMRKLLLDEADKISGHLLLTAGEGDRARIAVHRMKMDGEGSIPCDQVATLAHHDYIHTIALCDHTSAFAGTETSITQWDLATRQPIWRVPYAGCILAVTESMVAAAGEADFNVLIDRRSQTVIHKFEFQSTRSSCSKLQLDDGCFSMDHVLDAEEFLFDLRRLDEALLVYEAGESTFHSGVGLLAVSSADRRSVALYDWRQPIATGCTLHGCILPNPTAILSHRHKSARTDFLLMDCRRLFCLWTPASSGPPAFRHLSLFDFAS